MIRTPHQTIPLPAERVQMTPCLENSLILIPSNQEDSLEYAAENLVPGNYSFYSATDPKIKGQLQVIP
jgi:hypothetical protein